MDPLAIKNALPDGFKLMWYEIKGVLGRGGFGVTYLARDTNLDCDVAIKEYFPAEYAQRESYTHTIQPTHQEHSETYEAGLRSFVEEARTLAKLSHKSIVRVLSVFNFNHTAYMVMDFEEGENLANLIAAKTAFEERELKNLTVRLLEGLSFIHSKGFIHRDIKPANIIIRGDGTPVLLDFGSARESIKQTRHLTRLVSYGYTPFEQYNAASDKQGPWCDIYALAATLYHTMTQNKPADAMSRASEIMNNNADPLIPLSHLAASQYSDSFLYAIEHALHFNYQERPQNALIWRDMLLSKIHIKPVNPATSDLAAIPLGAQETYTALDQEQTQKQEQTHNVLIAFICAIALALALAWFFTRSLDQDHLDLATEKDNLQPNFATERALDKPASSDTAPSLTSTEEATFVSLEKTVDTLPFNVSQKRLREMAPKVIEQFKRAIEFKNLMSLQKIAVISPAKQRLIKQLFERYETIEVEEIPTPSNPLSEEISRILSFTKLTTSQGHTFEPEANWRYIRLTIKANPEGNLRVYW